MKIKSKKMIQTVAFFLCGLLLFLSVPFGVAAEEPASEKNASHILLYCINTESLLYEKNSEEPIAPGLSAQLMTALLTIEHFNDLDTIVTLNEALLSTWYFPADYRSHLDYGFSKNATVPVKDLLAAMILENATSAASLLAALVGGSEEAFVEKMNSRAASLGMTATTYQNPTGIDKEGATTTVKDLFLLTKHLHKEAKLTTLAASTSYTLQGNGFTVYTRNYLIGSWYTSEHLYKNANGMKAWHTEASGHSIIATSVENNGYSYIAIVMGGKEDAFGNNRVYTVATDFLKWGGTGFRTMTLLSKAEPITSLPVIDGDRTNSIPIFPQKDITAYLANTVTKDDLSYEIFLTEDSLTAPFSKDTVVGEIKVFLGEEEVGTCPLITVTDVALSTSAKTRNGLRSFFKNPITVIAMIFLFLVILRKIILSVRRQKKKQVKQS